MVRRYPRILSEPAALPLFCLAPHGVFRASRIAPRAVSSYLAFSPLPVLLSKNRWCLFCDTLRHCNFSTAAPACFTRHAAVWCSDFPPANLTVHQRSSAIGRQLSTNNQIWKPGIEELGATRCTVQPRGSGERFGRTANETKRMGNLSGCLTI